MSLERVPRYPTSSGTDTGAHAVVVGGSMAGLCAARVLADHFDSVTVLERDEIPGTPTTRDGAPQTSHPHALLEGGRATLEDLFPGLSRDLLSAGGVLSSAHGFEFYTAGGVLAPPTSRMALYCASRPLIEHVARTHIQRFDAVTLRGGVQVIDYTATADDAHVTGVEYRDGSQYTTLDADLVVDASGRNSHTPGWLADRGYRTPPTSTVDIGVSYTTVRVDRPEGDRRGYFASPHAPRTIGAVVLPVEAGKWEVMLQACHDETTPRDPDAVVPFADRIPVDGVAAILDNHDWIGDLHHYPFPESRRNHYEALNSLPAGLVVVGDAVASFNPVYGQGMSAAALQALVLHHTLAETEGLDIGQQYFADAARVVEDAWQISVGSDFGFAATTGPKPTGTDLFNRYVDRLLERAQTDGHLTKAFFHVIRLERPPTSLLAPSIVARVLTP